MLNVSNLFIANIKLKLSTYTWKMCPHVEDLRYYI